MTIWTRFADGRAGSKEQDPAYVDEQNTGCLSDIGRVLFFGPAAVFGAILAFSLSASLVAAPGRRVTFRAEDGVTLTAAYYEAGRRPAPGILLLPMLRRSHIDWDAAASQLSDSGFAVLALDFRGGEDVAGFARDVRAAKAFLRERLEGGSTSIGMAGASLSANLALADAADDPGVMSIALLSPGIDYRGIRTEAPMKKYAGRSAILLGSTRDPYSSRSIRQLMAIGPGTREVRLTDAVAHGTNLLSRDPDLLRVLVDWFRRTL